MMRHTTSSSLSVGELDDVPTIADRIRQATATRCRTGTECTQIDSADGIPSTSGVCVQPVPPGCAASVAHGLISYTWLNGVSATLANRVNPPCATTSRIRAGPAWVPSASPTSCESEAGVQSSVENP